MENLSVKTTSSLTLTPVQSCVLDIFNALPLKSGISTSSLIPAVAVAHKNKKTLLLQGVGLIAWANTNSNCVVVCSETEASEVANTELKQVASTLQELMSLPPFHFRAEAAAAISCAMIEELGKQYIESIVAEPLTTKFLANNFAVNAGTLGAQMSKISESKTGKSVSKLSHSVIFYQSIEALFSPLKNELAKLRSSSVDPTEQHEMLD